MNKKNTSIIGIIILGIIIFFVLRSISSKENVDDFKNDVAQNSTGQMCFLYEQALPEDSLNEVQDAFNREYIEITTTDDGKVSGIHNILPFEKDSNRATFIGVTDGTFVNVIATAQAEGQTWQEQRLYKIGDDRLLVGYQPVYVPQYKNDAGIYMYEDINKIAFETDEFFLLQVDCAGVEKNTVL